MTFYLDISKRMAFLDIYWVQYSIEGRAVKNKDRSNPPAFHLPAENIVDKLILNPSDPMPMKRCPYCFESLKCKHNICPHCAQFIIDDLIEIDYEPADTKRCVFCGKNILTEAVVCRHCHRWLDELNDAINDAEETS